MAATDPDLAERIVNSIALPGWKPTVTGGRTRGRSPASLQVLTLSRVQSSFGGTTEIQKEIIARNLGL